MVRRVLARLQELQSVRVPAHSNRFKLESEALRASWGVKDDDFLDTYLRTGNNRWDLDPCRSAIRAAINDLAVVFPGDRLTCLEIGCGSGNEYDGFAGTGLLDRLQYT